MSSLLTAIIFTILLVWGISLIGFMVAFGEEEKFDTGVGSNHGNNHPSKENCHKSDTLEEFAKKVDAMKCKDGNIKNYKSYDFYKLEDDETEECLDDRAEMGNKLQSYEVQNCYTDPDYHYRR